MDRRRDAMSFRIAEKEEPGSILAGGLLRIEHAGEIRDALMIAFKHADRVTLTIERDAVADLSFLQMLCAAHRTALREKKKFELDSSAAPGVQDVIQEAGFVYDSGNFCDPGVRSRGSRGGENV
jgi:hypothetical protein